MPGFIVAIVIIFLIAGLPLLWLAAMYNRFVRLTQHIRESWSNIDVELKRRYELIPNLVETAKGYAKHEHEVLERVIEKMFSNKLEKIILDVVEKAISREMAKLKEIFIADASNGE